MGSVTAITLAAGMFQKALDIEFGILAYFNKNVFIQALFESFLAVLHLKPINIFGLAPREPSHSVRNIPLEGTVIM